MIVPMDEERFAKAELRTDTLALAKRLLANELLRLGAVSISMHAPFRLVSGNYSPIYINCRRLISDHAFLDFFTAAARVSLESMSVTFDCVAGGETAGIPFATVLARALSSQLLYVRKDAKSHGVATRIEGRLQPGSHVLLVEDLITDAGSKLSFIEALQSAGAKLAAVLVVFDRQQGGKKQLALHGVPLLALCEMESVVARAVESNWLSAIEERDLRLYLAAPRDWHAHRGLTYDG